MMVVKVVTNLELDLESVFGAVCREYDCEPEDVSIDDVFEYVSNHVKPLSTRGGVGIEGPSDGPSINYFQDSDTIEDALDKWKHGK